MIKQSCTLYSKVQTSRAEWCLLTAGRTQGISKVFKDAKLRCTENLQDLPAYGINHLMK